MKQITHWIDGKPFVGDSQRFGKVFNPATGEQTGEVQFATVDEVDAAVVAAREALTGWRTTSLAKRATAMFALRELLSSHVDELAAFRAADRPLLATATGPAGRGAA